MLFLSACDGGDIVPILSDITFFEANPSNITEGNNATLSWSVSNATSVYIDHGIGQVNLNDSISVSPDSTTTYTITATNNIGTVTDSVTLTVSEAEEEHLVLQPTNGKEADVIDAYPDDNYGDFEEFWVGYWTDTSRLFRTYIQFDLSSIPAGAVITDASLELYLDEAEGSGSMEIELQKVNSSWQEDSITWNIQPAFSSKVESSSYVGSTDSNDWKVWGNLEQLVQGWNDGSIANYGMFLKAANESSVSVVAKFISSDSNKSNNYYPKLVVDYYLP